MATEIPSCHSCEQSTWFMNEPGNPLYLFRPIHLRVVAHDSQDTNNVQNRNRRLSLPLFRRDRGVSHEEGYLQSNEQGYCQRGLLDLNSLFSFHDTSGASFSFSHNIDSAFSSENRLVYGGAVLLFSDYQGGRYISCPDEGELHGKRVSLHCSVDNIKFTPNDSDGKFVASSDRTTALAQWIIRSSPPFRCGTISNSISDPPQRTSMLSKWSRRMSGRQLPLIDLTQVQLEESKFKFPEECSKHGDHVRFGDVIWLQNAVFPWVYLSPPCQDGIAYFVDARLCQTSQRNTVPSTVIPGLALESPSIRYAMRLREKREEYQQRRRENEARFERMDEAKEQFLHMDIR